MDLNIPPFRWLGRKTKEIKKIEPFLPKEYNNFHELMCGSLALTYSGIINANEYYVNDYNYHLIRAIRTIVYGDLEKVINILDSFENTKECYYKIRELDRKIDINYLTDELITARFIFICNCGFRGLWRENKRGQLNTPFGFHNNSKIYNKESLYHYREFLSKRKLKIYYKDFCDYVFNTNNIKENDFVYIDPPYLPIENQKTNFNSYLNGSFEAKMHNRIKEIAIHLQKKNVKVMISNSYSLLTKQIYNGLNFNEFITKRTIATKTKDRKELKEYVITNY